MALSQNSREPGLILFSCRVLTLPSFSRKTRGVRPGRSAVALGSMRSMPNSFANAPYCWAR